MKNKRLEYVAIGLLVISLCIVIVFIIFWCCWQNSHSSLSSFGSLTGGIIACMISAANAILLYVTLKAQQEDIANSKRKNEREHFEESFFLMLDRLDKVESNIVVQYEDIDSVELELKVFNAQGRYFFKFLYNELYWLKENFSDKASYVLFSESELSLSIEGLNEELNGNPQDNREDVWSKRKKSLYEIEKRHLTNNVYNIQKDQWVEIKTKDSSQIEKECYSLIKRKWFFAYEQWMRNVTYILQYIVDNAPKAEQGNQSMYFDMLRSQLTKEELRLIELHKKVDNKLLNLCEQAKLIQ